MDRAAHVNARDLDCFFSYYNLHPFCHLYPWLETNRTNLSVDVTAIYPLMSSTSLSDWCRMPQYEVSALSYACIRCDNETVKLLVDRGADLDIQNGVSGIQNDLIFDISIPCPL